MPPVGNAITILLGVALLVGICLFLLSYKWNKDVQAERKSRSPSGPLFYFAVVLGVALVGFSYYVNQSALLRHFASVVPNRKYWAKTDAFFATIPYAAMLILPFIARNRIGLLIMLCIFLGIMAEPFAIEAIWNTSSRGGDDYEGVVIDRAIGHGILALFAIAIVCGSTFGRSGRRCIRTPADVKHDNE